MSVNRPQSTPQTARRPDRAALERWLAEADDLLASQPEVSDRPGR